MSTNKSILFDLDETLFSMQNTQVKRINNVYPDIQKKEAFLLPEYILQKKNIVGYSIAIQHINQPRMFADQNIYDEVYHLISKLIQLKYDVWFVTQPLPNYSLQCSIAEKKAQISRFFGVAMSQKIIFEKEKWKVPGMILVDDNSKITLQQENATWKAVIFSQCYNINQKTKYRVEFGNLEQQLLEIIGELVNEQKNM